MSEGEFRAEMRYRMSLAVARAMLEEGAITEEEYSEIDTILLKKHRPPASQSASILKNSLRLAVPVPDIPQSAYTPAYSHSGLFWMSAL